MWSGDAGLDDLDQILDEADNMTKKNAKQGRRARAQATPPDPVDDGAAEEAEETMMPPPTAARSRDADAPPRPNRRMGGWGDDSNKRGQMEELEDARLRPQTPQDSDSDNDIPVIPDLEDQQDEEITSTVAMAPNVAVNRVATYRELDNDLLRHAQFLTLDNEIDLKLLAKCLSAEADVQEEDKPWDWDRLFTEVTSELLTEWEKKEEKEQDEEADIAA